VVLLCVFITPVYSQNLTETQWYFGASEANLQFDKNGILVYEETFMNPQFGIGGGTTISDDVSGDLLYYSDGVSIFNRFHEPIDGIGTLSGNNSANQAAVSMRLPGNSTTHYIFYNPATEGSEVQYAILDQRDFSIRSVGNPTGLIDPSEAMLIIKASPDSLSRTNWLITQNRNTLDFQVTLVDSVGIGGTQVFNLDTTLINPGAVAAHFAYNRDSALLAVAPQSANRNVLLLDFSERLGTLRFNRLIPNTGFDDGQGESVYDVEWSEDGSKLFVSRFGAADSLVGNVLQYDLADSSLNPVLPEPVYRSYGLQRGIDRKIYHLYQDSIDSPFLVGRFDQIDSVAASVI
jgi:hypothetical protein